MVVFHSYVSLPEGSSCHVWVRKVLSPFVPGSGPVPNFRAAGFRDASFAPMTCQKSEHWKRLGDPMCPTILVNTTIWHTQPIWGRKIWENDLKKNSCFFGGRRFFFTERPATYGSSEVTTDTTIDAAALGETRGVSRISHLKSMEKS